MSGTCLTGPIKVTFLLKILFYYYLLSNPSSSFLFKYQWRSPLVQKLPLLKGFQSRNAESDWERYGSIKCELKHRSISIIADLNQILWSTCSSNQTLRFWSPLPLALEKDIPVPNFCPKRATKIEQLDNCTNIDNHFETNTHCLFLIINHILFCHQFWVLVPRPQSESKLWVPRPLQQLAD